MIKCLFANPNIGRVENSWTLFVAGTDPDRAVSVAQSCTSIESAIESVHSLPGEYTTIGLTERGNDDPSLIAHRGITSGFDVYYFENCDGEMVVSDHFRNAVAKIPVENRSVTPTTPIDQLFYGTIPTRSPIREINRLNHGETLTWESGDQPTIELTGQIDITTERTVGEAIDDTNSLLKDICDSSRFDRSIATMFSGGVDSTLLHSYFSEEIPTISGAFDSPEFRTEVDYALEASDQLGTEHELIELDESRYLDELEKTIDKMGFPARHLQSTLVNAVLEQSDYDTYFNGQYADAVFGLALVKWAKMAWYVRHVHGLIPPIHRYSSKLKNTAQQLTYPVEHPDGLASGFAMHSSSSRIEDVFDRDRIRERKRAQLRYLKDRFDRHVEANLLDEHLHYGHLVDFLHDHTINQWRHLAFGHDAELQTPFSTKRMLEISLSVPAGNRYYDGFKNKHILKRLLDDRLPSYDATKRKGSGALPRARYIGSGPLSDIWDQYDIPEWVPDRKTNLITDYSDHVAWYAISYSIWEDRILNNRDLKIFDHTDIVHHNI